jgi:hypothetical protein
MPLGRISSGPLAHRNGVARSLDLPAKSHSGLLGRRWKAAHGTGGTLDQRAHAAALACASDRGSERGGCATAEGLRHDGTNSSGARTSARRPHRRGVDGEAWTGYTVGVDGDRACTARRRSTREDGGEVRQPAAGARGGGREVSAAGSVWRHGDAAHLPGRRWRRRRRRGALGHARSEAERRRLQTRLSVAREERRATELSGAAWLGHGRRSAAGTTPLRHGADVWCHTQTACWRAGPARRERGWQVGPHGSDFPN